MPDTRIQTVPDGDIHGPYAMLTLGERMYAHDLGGDGILLFVGEAAPVPGVRVFHRDTKQELGKFPPPSRGHIVPFKFRLKSYRPLGQNGSEGSVYVMDGVYPKIVGLYDTLILEYEYRYDGRGDLRVNLAKEYRIRSNTVPFDQMQKGTPPDGAMYPTGFDLIDNDRIILTDCFAGAIWVFDLKTEALTAAFTHPDFLPQPWPEDLKITLPDGSVQDGFSGWTHHDRSRLVPYLHQIPFSPGVPKMMPGLHGVTIYKNGTNEKVVFVSVARGGIYSLDVSELLRSDIPCWGKRFDTVVPDIRGVSSHVTEVQADTFNPTSPWIYFQRALSRSNEVADRGYEIWKEKYNPLYRVNIETRRVEFVAEDWKLWDFVSNLNVIPGEPGSIRLTSTPTQQHRLPGASGLIADPDDYSRLPKDFVFPVIDVKG